MICNYYSIKHVVSEGSFREHLACVTDDLDPQYYNAAALPDHLSPSDKLTRGIVCQKMEIAVESRDVVCEPPAVSAIVYMKPPCTCPLPLRCPGRSVALAISPFPEGSLSTCIPQVCAKRLLSYLLIISSCVICLSPVKPGPDTVFLYKPAASGKLNPASRRRTADIIVCISPA